MPGLGRGRVGRIHTFRRSRVIASGRQRRACTGHCRRLGSALGQCAARSCLGTAATQRHAPAQTQQRPSATASADSLDRSNAPLVTGASSLGPGCAAAAQRRERSASWRELCTHRCGCREWALCGSGGLGLPLLLESVPDAQADSEGVRSIALIITLPRCEHRFTVHGVHSNGESSRAPAHAAACM